MSFSFANFVKDQAAAAGTNADLSRAWGVSEMQIGRWIDGQVPLLSTILDLLSNIGGDIGRAFPGYKPKDSKVKHEPIYYVGKVQGGKISASEIHDYRDSEIEFQDIWRKSPWYTYVSHDDPIVLAEVRGDSMAPVYPDGCMIAMRKPVDQKAIPLGAPCVFRQGHDEHAEYTFKIFRQAATGEMIGWPLNSEHDPIVFKNTKNVFIEFIVLGVMNRRPQSDYGPGSDLASQAVRLKASK